MAEQAVLVTRPAGQTENICQLLREAGFLPVEQAMIIIEPLVELDPSQRQLVLDLDSFQHVIFVSSNAVACGMEWICQFWPQLPVGLHWYAVGAASAASLREFGLEVHQPAVQMDSEGLLQLLQLRSVAGQKVLIVKGQGGRKLLADRLTQRAARVDELATYRRLCPRLEAGALPALLQQHRFAALMFNSGEALHNMVSLLPAPARVPNLPLVLPGERVAKIAREQGFSRIVVANNATDEAMVDALRNSIGRGKQGGRIQRNDRG